MKKLFLIGLMFHLAMFVNLTASSHPKAAAKCMNSLQLIDNLFEAGKIRVNMAKSPIGQYPVKMGFYVQLISTPEQMLNPMPGLLHLKGIFEGSAQKTIVVTEDHTGNESINAVSMFFKEYPAAAAQLLESYVQGMATLPYVQGTILADRYSPLTSNVYASIVKKRNTNVAGGGASAQP